MNLIESYSLSAALEIDRPQIVRKYFPLPFEQYITFHSQTPYNSRNYDYWQLVIDILCPILQKNNIQIVQLGFKDDKPINKTYSLLGQTNIHQAAYIISNSLLHFGVDSFNFHLAASFNVPIVEIFSANKLECSRP